MNPYSGRAISLLDGMAPGDIALDIGSGGRGRPSPTCVRLEWEHGPANDVTGDGQALPFRDGAFAVVITQATVEHVPRPHDLVDEAFRVLRPGGVFLAEVAFMQPIHCAPHHYFNMTPYGLRYLCRRFEIVDSGTIGYLDETIRWMCQASGVRTPRGLMRDVPPDLEEVAASGVWLTGRRPI